MSTDVIGTVQEFGTAGEFLDALHPMDARWEIGPPEQWVFRGHWDSRWELVPTIYRYERVEPFTTWEWNFKSSRLLIPGIERQILAKAVDEFDKVGLPIPEPLMVRKLLEKELDEIDEHLIPFMALAQHHGVPTRLLDWTTQGKVAAYFAASELVKNPDKQDGWMEVISLNRAVPQDEHDKPVCRICRAPRSSNVNLHAQSGLFTLSNGKIVDTPLDMLLFGDEAPAPHWFSRLRLPQEQAPALLQHLSYEGVNGATIFPGYDGVVRRMKEERFYWNRKRWL